MMKGVVTRYQGEGIWRVVYFTVLLTHTPLAVLIVPFSLTAVYQACRGNFVAHVKITRWLLPVWMYVSVTGVLIYLMLYVW
jgi:putative membrane protein